MENELLSGVRAVVVARQLQVFSFITMKNLYLYCTFFLVFVCFWSVHPVGAQAQSKVQQMRDLYNAGIRAKQRQKWALADRSFRRLVPLLRGQQAKSNPVSQQYHGMTLGLCDVYYHLAVIAWKRNQKRRSCRYDDTLQQALKTVPARWNVWSTNPMLKGRIKASALHLKHRCARVPSLLLVQTTPKASVVWRKLKSGRWSKLASKRIRLLGSAPVKLKVTAKGFREKRLSVSVPRWQTKRMRVSLSALPTPKRTIEVVVVRARPKIIVRSKKPSPAPIYTRWWFWTITGVVVAGAATGVVLGVVVSQQATQTIQTPPGQGEGLPVW